ncbi:hypothetical protein IscW_ISCW001915, partial [Ixodes scapularis]
CKAKEGSAAPLHRRGRLRRIRVTRTVTATPPSVTTTVTTTGQTGQSEAGSTSGSPDDYEKAKQLLHDHFTPRVNRDYEIFNFRKTTQQDGETIDAFYTRLR